MEKLQQIINYAYEHSKRFRERLDQANVQPAMIRTSADLEQIPIIKKDELPTIQKSNYPFGGLETVSPKEMARIFMSPGPIYDPQSFDGDYWGFAEALQAAGFTNEDIVQNTFSYHLSPAGFMFDSALRAIGATVVPAGTGNRELQVQIMKDLQVTGYVGTPSFLAILLETTQEKGYELSLKKAFFTAEKLTKEMKERLAHQGINVFEGYGTADCGCLAFEDGRGPGLKVSSRAIIQICDPISGKVVDDEEGEVVVTLLDPTYPLIRFGTGDVSRWVEGYEGKRIVGVLGRVGTSVKVKGMFVHEQQLLNVMKEAGYEQFQAIVTHEDGQDCLKIFVESVHPLSEDVLGRVKDVIRVTPTFVRVDQLEKRPHYLVDERKW
jgi:phenylacetate-CoA ligase